MSVYTGESSPKHVADLTARGELLTWINGLLGTDHQKIEMLGTGAIYCQIMDSIFGNLPMSRVKYDAKADYEYLENFKILQACFKRNGVEKPIPVERLIKCKMQDNLEFCQWMKKYWDGAERKAGYDAEARSGGQQARNGSAPAAARRAPTTAARTASRTNPVSSGGARTVSSAQSSHLQAQHAAQLAEMTAQVQDLQVAYEDLERERAFYFDKLRKVEVIATARVAVEGIAEEEKAVLNQITEILYAADGLEHIEGEEEADMLADEELPEEETF